MADGEDDSVFKIMVASDIHLGYAEKDAIRGDDSFVSFEEVMKKAQEHGVDFVLLGGDLFHDNKPSRSTLQKGLAILKKFCFGTKPVTFDTVCDLDSTFDHAEASSGPNYLDPNVNVSLPVFTVHGNHDDPIGVEGLSIIDILATAGLVNFFGKVTSLESVQMKPVLLTKGQTKLALFGLGAMKDERLHRLFLKNLVSVLRPSANNDTTSSNQEDDPWFNICVLHQNRAAHTQTSHIPENFLPGFLDLVLWGHEHECRIVPEWNPTREFYVTQPGSPVATSLADGEAVPKHCGVLEIRGKEFKLTPVPLTTVRPMLIEIFDLSSALRLTDLEGYKSACETSASEYTRKIQATIEDECKNVIDGMIAKANRINPDIRPLIRLKVDCDKDLAIPNFLTSRLAHHYHDCVANPKDLLVFRRRALPTDPESLFEEVDSGVAAALNIDMDTVNVKVESIVEDLLASDSLPLKLMPKSAMNTALQQFVVKSERAALAAACEAVLKDARGYLNTNVDAANSIDEEIDKWRNQDIAGDRLQTVMAGIVKKGRGVVDSDSDLDNIEDLSSDDDDLENKPPSKGRGRGKAKSTRGAKNNASMCGGTNKYSESMFLDSQDSQMMSSSSVKRKGKLF